MDLTVVFIILLAVVDPASAFDCVTFTNGCSDRKDGDYALCYPLCTGGGYITCNKATPYLRQCPINSMYNPNKKKCDGSAANCKPQSNTARSVNQHRGLHRPQFLAVLTSVVSIVLSTYCWHKF